MRIFHKIVLILFCSFSLNGSLRADEKIRELRIAETVPLVNPNQQENNNDPADNRRKIGTAPSELQLRGEPSEFYTARLSVRDHYNSSGARLQSPAAIIRQDRANFYVYGLRDPEDEPDSFFSSKQNRARLEQMLENGRTTREAIDRIVNGTPLIRVDVDSNGITVTILSD